MQKYNSAKAKEYYLKNRDTLLGKSKEYYFKNRSQRQQYYVKNQQKIFNSKSYDKEYRRKYYLKNRDHILNKAKLYQDTNRLKIRKYNRQYYHDKKNRIINHYEPRTITKPYLDKIIYKHNTQTVISFD